MSSSLLFYRLTFEKYSKIIRNLKNNKDDYEYYYLPQIILYVGDASLILVFYNLWQNTFSHTRNKNAKLD